MEKKFISMLLDRCPIVVKGLSKGLSKFNNSLALNSDFFDSMKAHIANTQKSLDKENIRDDQTRLEYLKYETRKFSIKFSKLLSKTTKTQTLLLEKKLNN